MSLTKVTYSMVNGAPVNAADYPTVQVAVTAAEPTRSIVVVNSATTASDVQLKESPMQGSGSLTAGVGATSVLLLGWSALTNTWRFRRLDGLLIDGNNKASNGVTFSDTTSTELSGRWTLENVAVRLCDIGVYKPTGNIGNTFLNVNFNGCNYGYRAEGTAVLGMHPGADRFIGGEFSSCALAAIYIDSSTVESGQITIDGTVIEGCPGFGIYVKSWAVGYVPLVIRNVWFELNASSPSVVIDGVAQAPHDIFLNEAENVIIEQCPIVKVRFINSKVLIDQCILRGSSEILVTNSSVRITNALLDDFGSLTSASNVQIESVGTIRRAAGSAATRFWAVPRTTTTKIPTNNGTRVAGQSFDGAAGIAFGTLTSTQLAGNHPLFAYSARYTQLDATTEAAYPFTADANSFFVFTLDLAQVSGTPPNISIAAAGVLFPTITCFSSDGTFRTVAGICFTEGASVGAALNIVNSTGGTSVYALSSFQVVKFTTLTDAISFFNSRTYALA